MKILIVDDSKAMRMIVTRTLRQAALPEHTIAEAEDGQVALDVLANGGITVVLSDWNMPVMSGLELLQALRSRGDRVPFGFVTSESTPAMRATAMQAGASFLIAKPFTAEDFTQVLTALAA